MAKIELPKLKGLYDLSNKDYQIWINQQLQDGSLNEHSSFDEADRLYKDQQFKQNFGEELFTTMSAHQRDAYYDTYAQEQINTRYGDNEEVSSLLSPQAKAYLFENGYLTQAEREKLDIEDQESIQEIRQALDDATLKSNSQKDQLIKATEMDIAKKIAKRNKENEKIFVEAKAIDNNNILQDDEVLKYKSDLTKYYQKQVNYSENGAADLDEEITNFLNTKIEGRPLFNYFATYQDKPELENFNLQDKVDLYTDWQAILQKASKIEDEESRNQYIMKAADIINEKLQNKVHDDRRTGQRTKINLSKIKNYALAGLGNSAASHIVNKLYAEGVEKGDLTAYYNFLQGKDENGNTLNKWLNMSYLSDVVTYNTTDTAEILKAKQNGGLSPMQHVSKYGEEYDFWTKETWGEGFAMIGHQLPQIATDFLLTKGKKTVRRAATRGLLRALPKNVVKEITKVTSSQLANFLGDAARVYVHASPEAAMEGKSNFDIVYDEVIQKQNTFLNSEEGKNVIEQEVQNRFNKLYPGGVYDPQIPVLNNDGQPSIYSREEAIKETIRQGVIEDIKQNFENTALEAAGKAYQSTYYSFLLKNSVTDLAFQSYTFAGRTPFSSTKNPKIRFNYDGTAKSLAPTAWDITKAVAKPSIGGFIEESTDEMANQGSQQLGLNYANNYIQHLYQGNLEPVIEDNIGSGFAYIQGAANALYDKSTWHQAFTGAISPFTNFLPNVGGIINRGKMTKEQLDQLTAIEKISSYIFNPLINNIANEYQESRSAKEFADSYNKTVEKYGDNFKSVVQTLNLIDQLEESKLTNNPRQQKDAEHKLGFNFVSSLYQMAQQHDGNNLATQYLQTINRLAKGDITANELAEFKQKVENRGKYNGEEGDASALKVIQNNAKKLQQLFKDYKATRTMLENAYGNTISQEAIEELTHMSILTPHWQNRKKQMEQDLGISSSKNVVRGRKTRRGVEREIEILKKNIQAAEDVVANTDTKKKSLKKIRQNLQKRLKIAEEDFKKGVTTQALTTEEILNASVIERQNMFENKQDYSVEQQEFIEEAEKILQQKDPDWRTKIEDIAVLENAIEQNEELYNALSQNPKDLENYIKYMHSTYLNRLLSSYINHAVDELEIQLDQEEVGSNEWHATINKYGKGVITALKEQYEKEGKMTDSLRKALNKAEKLAGLISNIHNIVEQSQLPKEVKKNLREAVLAIINDASSYSKALNALQNALNNPNIAEDIKSLIQTLLEKITKVEEQKKSTKKQQKQQKKQDNNKEEDILEDDSKPEDSQEFVITSEDDINSEDQQKVEEELPESEEKEPSKMNLKDFVLFGNSMLGYMLDKLREGILKISRGLQENDLKSTYFKWLEKNGLYPQRIVDYELSAYKALGIPLQVAMIKLPEEGANSPMNQVASKTLLLVIKADDRVKRIHKESNGKYIIIKGQEYLVVGNLGYKNENQNQKNIFFELIDQAKISRKEYFDKEENKDEEFFLLPDQELSIGNITPGHLVHQLEEDTSKQQRSISTLLNEPKRNPRGISWNDLIWVIPTETGFKTSKNISLPSSFFSKTKGQYARTGQLFLAIKDPRGKFVTVQMKRYKSEDIQDGAFKNKILKQINDILDGVVERDHGKRLAAVKELSKYLLFQKEGGDNILIGTDQKHSITVKVDGQIYNFSEQDIANNKQQVIDVILGNKEKGIPGKFNIVFTQNTITDISKMKELDEAGVLTTDIAVLSTAGAQYSVIKGEAKEEDKTPEQPKTPIREYTRKESVLLNGKIYRYMGNRYVDENGQEISPETMNKINLLLQCQEHSIDYTERGSSYFVLNADINNLSVVAISGNGNNLRVCSNQEALIILKKINEAQMKENIENSSEDIQLDIKQEAENIEGNKENIQESKEKVNTSNEKVDVIEKNLGKNLHMSEKSFTFTQLSRHPEYRAAVRDLLTRKFGEAYTNAANKEEFLKSKGITTTSIQDVNAWMEHVENCK